MLSAGHPTLSSRCWVLPVFPSRDQVSSSAKCFLRPLPPTDEYTSAAHAPGCLPIHTIMIGTVQTGKHWATASPTCCSSRHPMPHLSRSEGCTRLSERFVFLLYLIVVGHKVPGANGTTGSGVQIAKLLGGRLQIGNNVVEGSCFVPSRSRLPSNVTTIPDGLSTATHSWSTNSRYQPNTLAPAPNWASGYGPFTVTFAEKHIRTDKWSVAVQNAVLGRTNSSKA